MIDGGMQRGITKGKTTRLRIAQLVHQVRLSPDRSNALVTVLPTRTLHKMSIDETAGAFSMAGQSLTFAQAPIR